MKSKLEQRSIDPPKARKDPKELKEHGDLRIDPYYWLRERESPDVRSYLEAENDYTESMMTHTEELQEKIYDEIVGRIKKDDASVPYLDRGYYYYTRYEDGKEYPIYGRKKGSLDAEEEIVLNVNELAEDHSFYHATGLEVSPNNDILAFGEDTLSRRIYKIRFKDLDSGKFLDDELPQTTGSVAWARDNKTVFYTQKDAQTLRPNKVYKHILGTDPEEDELIYHESDDTFYTYAYTTKSNDYIIIASSSNLSNEYRILKADQPDSDFEVFAPRERKHEHQIGHFGNHFYILTNWKARNFRLMKTPVDKTEKKHWEEVIPHREDILLMDVELFDDYMVLSERVEGITSIRVRRYDGSEDHYVDFGESAYYSTISVNKNFDTQTVRLGYTSMTTPRSVFDYDMEQRELTLKKEQEVLGDFDKEDYRTRRLEAPARDGESIPISLVYKKGYEQNGSHPLLLYGYGSYGLSMEPYFSIPRLSLLDRGFAFAIAHIRGGQEKGRRWYEDGKLLNKKNTFRDFIDAGEFLLDEQFTAPDKLFAMGGSAGGLLMGAVTNMKPKLFNGIVAAVPFVDELTTMLDESIPLTTHEYDEWGNPHEREYYDYIKSYSPYDNVTEQEYPAMLVMTGLHDSQVQYWEPAKWVARLRDLKQDDHPLLLHTNLDTGHGGASGRYRRYVETAKEYAFFLDLAGYNTEAGT